MIKSRIKVEKLTFDRVTFFCEKRDGGYSKREGMEIILTCIQNAFLMDDFTKTASSSC